MIVGNTNINKIFCESDEELPLQRKYIKKNIQEKKEKNYFIKNKPLYPNITIANLPHSYLGKNLIIHNNIIIYYITFFRKSTKYC